MIRKHFTKTVQCKLIITAFAFLGAIPAFAHTTQMPAVSASPALHLMNDDEFASFLTRLNTDILHSEAHLQKIDLKSLKLGLPESKELDRSYDRCVQTLNSIQEEIQRLSQRQTLKLDLFLLIDLNELARNLDALDEGLINPATISGNSTARKSLDYAREVLNMDIALASDISVFQNHFLAFAGVVDSTLEQADQVVAQPWSEK
jgi:hypothetical protein